MPARVREDLKTSGAWISFVLGSLEKLGFETADLAKAADLQPETLLDPEQMPGQRSRVLVWPYREGLTMGEATHPLTLLAVGLYGEVLPNQNGAPLRLIVPWKYGFKGIKSIVKMSFVERQLSREGVRAGSCRSVGRRA